MLSSWNNSERFRNACNEILNRRKNITVSGLWGGAKASFLLALNAMLDSSILFVCNNESDFEMLGEDLFSFSPFFPQSAIHVFSEQNPKDSMTSLFRSLVEPEKPSIILATATSLALRLPKRSDFIQDILSFSTGQKLDYDRTLSALSRIGYERRELVKEEGEFSARGEVFDIYPTGSENPVRMILSGDKIGDMKRFDAVTQRSGEKTSRISVIPARFANPDDRHSSGVTEYLKKDSVIVLDDNARDLPLRTALRVVRLSVLPKKGSFDLAVRQQRSFNGDIRALLGEALLWHGEGMKIYVFCNNTGEKSRLAELIDENAEGKGIVVPKMDFVIAPLNAGFVYPEVKLAVLTDSEIFSRYRIRHRYPKISAAYGLADFAELESGDYIVHERYGIGKYLGLKQIDMEGRFADYILIEYDRGDKLYVPIEDFNLVQKYIGTEGYKPRLSSLDSTSWSSVKSRVKKSVHRMARELLDIYASRRKLPGYAYPADSEYEKEFAAAFIYETTPSQSRAINEVKEDMTKTKPMDRIVCGDVGYGKTEVAMRASLKAVLSGKQVAVLAPTTILASQHYAVFGERFADYPVKIEMLSRFRSGKEQAEIVAGIRDGKIDIVIGTHRLIQKDIVFSDLGLVVIDEEHRFGVRHKEKLKHIRKTVDVLTMTATPIPRTLSMALGGVRDISIIDTPPPERLPIDTYMGEYDEKTVKMAVSNELKRGGQVFYVHNRVETILTVAARLETLLAGARIGVAHGQLSSSQLEKIMEKFINREYDVLVVTTIIESGLDIPNVNTMIITDAHKMGLAQLYQLRGRIGRDRYKAYCYVLYPRGEVLSDIAKRRLGTIFEHSELGAGFRIALEDLQLRGAGNILGAEQHGHMLYVGFDLYCKLLERAVDELRSGRKAETVEQDRGIEINLPAKAYIPLDYVESAAQRIAIYKRLASTRNREDIDGIEEELADCYGRPPEPCRVLFHVVEMRQLARRLDMSEISAVGSDVHLQFRGDTRNLVKKFSGLRDMGDCEIKVEGNEGLRVIIRNVPAETAGDIGKIRYFLQRLL